MLLFEPHPHFNADVAISPEKRDDNESENFENTWASVWVKIVSSWLCYAVYVWTLFAPLVLGRWRDFDYGEAD